MPTLGLAIIARDEEQSLPTLLDSITGAFDHVVLVDTGSTDRTIDTFKEWAETNRQPRTLGTFEWVDDFAAARNHAHSLLETDWHCWADGDDEIIGAEHLRDIVASAPPEVAGVLFDHVHQDPAFGIKAFPQCRLTRGNITWIDPIHERQVIDGDGVVETGPSGIHWLHHRTDWGSSTARNQRIYARWAETDPKGLIRQLRGRCTHESNRADGLERENYALRQMLEAAADRLTELTAA